MDDKYHLRKGGNEENEAFKLVIYAKYFSRMLSSAGSPMT